MIKDATLKKKLGKEYCLTNDLGETGSHNGKGKNKVIFLFMP